MEPRPVDELILAFHQAQEASRVAADHLAETKAALAFYMEENQRKTVKAQYRDGGDVFQVTYSKPKRYSVDEKGLRKALTAKVFDQYTEKKLNQTKLQAAIDTGEVDAMVVAKYLTENLSAPQLRSSMHAPEAIDK